jgi:hypothetical protein
VRKFMARLPLINITQRIVAEIEIAATRNTSDGLLRLRTIKIELSITPFLRANLTTMHA